METVFLFCGALVVREGIASSDDPIGAELKVPRVRRGLLWLHLPKKKRKKAFRKIATVPVTRSDHAAWPLAPRKAMEN